MADVHVVCRKKTSYAWAQYFRVLREEFEIAKQIIIVVENIDRDNIPSHISTEFIEMADALKKKYTCPVCLDPVTKETVDITFCGHIYCKECLKQVKQRANSRCAVCRKAL